MINEAVQFMQKYDESKVESTIENPISSPEVDRILENKKLKIIIVEVDFKDDTLSFNSFKILLDKKENEKDVNLVNAISIEDWLKENSMYVPFLEFEKYISSMGKSKAASNKMIGSVQSLMTFSLFHFRLNEKWFVWKKDKKDNEYFEFDKKINKFEISDDFFDFLEKKKKVLEDKNETAKLEKFISMIRIFNKKENLQTVYKKVIEKLIESYNLNKSSFGTPDDENVKKFIKCIKGTFVFLKLKEDRISVYNSFHESMIESKIFNKEEYTQEGKCPFCKKDDVDSIGVPNNFNSFDGDKFPNFHNTKTDSLNIRLCRSCCKKLNSFEQFLRKYRIDFFPLFIRADFELEEIKYIKQGLNFFDVLDHIINTVAKGEALDFILLHYKGDILYYDYVDSYRFELEGIYRNYLSDGIHAQKITLRQLIAIFADESVLGLKQIPFFDEVDTSETYKKYLVYKYRQKIFDLIYRNKRNFFDEDLAEITLIVLESRIRNQKSTWVKEKKLLDFYLNSDLFVRNPNIFIKKNKDGENMLEQIRKEKQEIVSGTISPNIDSDEKFAYYLGQTIYYLMSKSEAEDKMKLLSPIINAYEPEVLRKIVAEKYLDKYYYTLSTYHDFKHKIIATVFDYLSNLKVPFSKIKIPFYVGFFDENIFYSKTQGNNGEGGKNA